jgi:hypothetical protein
MLNIFKRNVVGIESLGQPFVCRCKNDADTTARLQEQANAIYVIVRLLGISSPSRYYIGPERIADLHHTDSVLVGCKFHLAHASLLQLLEIHDHGSTAFRERLGNARLIDLQTSTCAVRAQTQEYVKLERSVRKQLHRGTNFPPGSELSGGML